jgi:hypothetical protein
MSRTGIFETRSSPPHAGHVLIDDQKAEAVEVAALSRQARPPRPCRPITASPHDFWCLSPEALYELSHERRGEADRALRTEPDRCRERMASKVWRRCRSPLVAILLVAAAVAGLTGDLAPDRVCFSRPNSGSFMKMTRICVDIDSTTRRSGTYPDRHESTSREP